MQFILQNYLKLNIIIMSQFFKLLRIIIKVKQILFAGCINFI